MTTAGSGATGGAAAGGTTPPPAPGMSTPQKGLLFSTLAAAGLGILVLSTQKGTNAWPFTEGNSGYTSTRTYDSSRNVFSDTFKTSGGERTIQTPGGEIADLIATHFGLAEADYGPMTAAQRQKAYLLIDQDGSGIINRYEAEHVARDVVYRIAREGNKDY